MEEPRSRIVRLVGKDKMAVGTKHSCVSSRRIFYIIDGIVKIEGSITLRKDREIMPMEMDWVCSLRNCQ